MFKDMGDLVLDWRETETLALSPESRNVLCISVGAIVVPRPEDGAVNVEPQNSDPDPNADPVATAIAEMENAVAAHTSSPGSEQLRIWRLTAAPGWQFDYEKIEPAAIGGLVVVATNRLPVSHLAAAWVQERVVKPGLSNKAAFGYAIPRPLMRVTTSKPRDPRVSTQVTQAGTIVHVDLPRQAPPTGH
jgi:hypothetical protein